MRERTQATAGVLIGLLLSGVADAATQSAPQNWALDRIDQRSPNLNNSYSYTSTGSGVHIYILDSGINLGHNEFAGRIVVDRDYLGGSGGDCYGHGTAVAGIAAGSTYGVAKAATIHVLRTYGCSAPSGAAADQALLNAIDAMEWLRWNHQSPAVLNVSFNWTGCGSNCTRLRDAVSGLIAEGVVVVASAGNAPGAVDESITHSCFPNVNTQCPCDMFYGCAGGTLQTGRTNLPALAHPSVIVVGATDYPPARGYLDARVRDTHWGVDLYAPGSNLLTAALAGPTANQYFSQTSAAAPVVTGAVARYLQTHPTATPSQVETWLKLNATTGTTSFAPPWEAGLLFISASE